MSRTPARTRPRRVMEIQAFGRLAVVLLAQLAVLHLGASPASPAAGRGGAAMTAWNHASRFVLLGLVLSMAFLPAPSLGAKKKQQPSGSPAAEGKERSEVRDLEWPREGDLVGSDGAPMVLVPAGEFLLGSNDSDPDATDHEVAQKPVRLGAFYIDKFEVTWGQYKRFLSAIEEAGHAHCASIEPPGRDHTPRQARGETRWTGDDYPVTMVSWYEAAAYCGWAGKRLPMEREWEKAARGTDGRIYPWGEGPDRKEVRFKKRTHWINERLNFNSSYDGYARAAPVGSYPGGASPYGAEDMSGNVIEWVWNRFEAAANKRGVGDPHAPPDGKGWGGRRGGSFQMNLADARAAARFMAPLGSEQIDVGFRCAMDPPGTRGGD